MILTWWRNKLAKLGSDNYLLSYIAASEKIPWTGLWYAKFMEMVSSNKTSLDPQKLPPPQRAEYFHSLWVQRQDIVWRKLTNDDLGHIQLGCTLDGTVLMPGMTDLDAAPESLLKFVRRKCKVSSQNPCGNDVCPCHKNWLKCVTACRDCWGESCQNSEDVILEEERENVGTDNLNMFQ